MQTPDTQRIASDIRALERHIRKLNEMQLDLTSRIVVMGPGGHGRDALAAYGVPEALASLIQSYQTAMRDLSDQHTEADIAECIRQLFTLHGQERAEMRRYLLDEIREYREGSFGRPAVVEKEAA